MIRPDLLERLCDLLESLPRECFDYGRWASGADLNVCGTTACALGWATTIPECGLRISSWGIKRALANKYDEQAAAVAFGISVSDAATLFYPRSWSVEMKERGPSADASPTEVAAWIRRHVAVWRTALEGAGR